MPKNKPIKKPSPLTIAGRVAAYCDVIKATKTRTLVVGKVNLILQEDVDRLVAYVARYVAWRDQ